jgi:hypothetical protein
MAWKESISVLNLLHQIGGFAEKGFGLLDGVDADFEYLGHIFAVQMHGSGV